MTENELREEIVRLMLACKWRGNTAVDLAEKHGMKPLKVKRLAIEASRSISLFADVHGQTAAAIAELDHCIRLALERKGRTMGGDEYDNPDIKAAVSAIRVKLEAWGVIGGRRKHALDEATPGNVSEEYAKMSPKERIGLHLKAIEEEQTKIGDDNGANGIH